MAAGRAPELLASLVDEAPSHLDEDMQLASETFRRFADEQIAPQPNTCTAPTPTYPRSSSRDSPNSGSSVSPRRSSTAASPRVASTTTSAWSSPPRNSPRLARHRRFADHTTRDPHSGPDRRRHRGTRTALATSACLGQGHGRRRGHRAGLRIRRRRHSGGRHPDLMAGGSSTVSRHGAPSPAGPTS